MESTIRTAAESEARSRSQKGAGGQFNVYFDGGGNKRVACYGSWEVHWRGFKKRVERELFPQASTNNTAEWLALIRALEWLQSVAGKESYAVVISGDSQLVLYQLEGRYRCKKQHLALKRQQAVELLSGFGGWETVWKPRAHSVRRFGH